MLKLPLPVETVPPSNVTVAAEVVVAEPAVLEPWMSRLPPLVVIFAPIVTLLPAPKTKVRALLAGPEMIDWLMLIEPAAIMVRVAAPPPVFEIPADIVMSPDWPPVVEDVRIVTLVPSLSEVSILAIDALAEPVLSGVKVSAPPIVVKSPFELLPEKISTFAGSNNQRPPCPLTADAITVPKA